MIRHLIRILSDPLYPLEHQRTKKVKIMNKRTVKTGKVRVNSLTYSSIFDIGDANTFKPETKALAVQREEGVPSDEGFEFENYDIFEQELPTPPEMALVNQQTYQHNPNITVKNVDITGISTSSLFQIGSIKTIDTMARIKHIRIINDEQN